MSFMRLVVSSLLLSAMAAVASGGLSGPAGGEPRPLHVPGHSPAYAFRALAGEGPAWEADNRAQSFRAHFRGDHVTLVPDGLTWDFRLMLSAWGRAGTMLRDAGAARLERRGDEMVFVRDDVEEWYRNTPAGLEQGFTLPVRPDSPPSSSAELELRVTVRGGLRATLSDGGEAIVLRDRQGRPQLTYRDLYAWDATQRVLPVRMDVDGADIVLHVDDSKAVYPLTVDPIVTTFEGKLEAPDAAAFDVFGNAIAIHGDTLVVGALNKTGAAGNGQGAAYVYVKSGASWVFQQKLLPNDPATNMQFGNAVAVEHDTIVVGAWRTSGVGSFQGAAYVFKRSGTSWAQEQKLTAPDAAAGDYFGSAVAISGDTVLIGAYHEGDPPLYEAGAAYVFVRSGTTWSFQQKLTHLDAALAENFGVSVALQGDTAVVGAWWAAETAGRAFVFERFGISWVETHVLMGSETLPDDLFGCSIAMSGNYLIIGAYGDDSESGLLDVGSAYVFVKEFGTWHEVSRLTAQSPAEADLFGLSVAMDGDMAAVGAPFANGSAGVDQGLVRVFRRAGGSWLPTSTIYASDAQPSDLFGTAVGLSSERIAVGCRGDDGAAGTNQGSAYVYRVHDPCPADLDGSGDVGQPDLGILLANYGCVGSPGHCPGDIFTDGKVDQQDLGLLLSMYEKPCPG
jgi:hypothetical protein